MAEAIAGNRNGTTGRKSPTTPIRASVRSFTQASNAPMTIAMAELTTTTMTVLRIAAPIAPGWKNGGKLLSENFPPWYTRELMILYSGYSTVAQHNTASTTVTTRNEDHLP